MAVAPPWLTTKLPWTSETAAWPQVVPLRPSESIRRPAGMSSGFLKVQPAEAMTGWEALRFSRDSSQRCLMLAGVVGLAFEDGLQGEVAPQFGDVAVVGDDFLALAGADDAVLIEEGDAHDLVEGFDAHRAGVHAQRAADVAGDAFHPLEAADAAAAGDAGEFLQAHARAGGDLAAAVPTVTSENAPPVGWMTAPRMPPSRTNRFEPRPTTRTGMPRSRQ